MGTIGHISQHRNLGTAVEPAYIVRTAALNHNLRPGHAHAAQALPHRPSNSYKDLVISGPDPAANAMLPLSLNDQSADSISNGLLYLFFQFLRGDTAAFGIAVNCQYFRYHI
jgi:hypothetical protein